MSFNYCFKLTTNVSQINLPYAIPSAESLRVNFVSYKTASANQKTMLFKINHFDNNYFYDGVDLIKYTKIILLPPSNSTPVIFENLSNQADVKLDTTTSQTSISSLRIEIMIDNAFSADISPSNPVYIELTIR